MQLISSTTAIPNSHYKYWSLSPAVGSYSPQQSLKWPQLGLLPRLAVPLTSTPSLSWQCSPPENTDIEPSLHILMRALELKYAYCCTSQDGRIMSWGSPFAHYGWPSSTSSGVWWNTPIDFSGHWIGPYESNPNMRLQFVGKGLFAEY